MKIFITAFVACATLFHCWNVLATIIHVPEDQPSIQSAIQVAAFGDTVLVSPGCYNENIDFIGRDIVLGSLFLTTGNVEYITLTVIDSDSGSVVSFSNGETQSTILCGFTITGGTGTSIKDKRGFIRNYGAGLFIRSARPIIRQNLITNNSTYPSCFGTGGGIAIMDSANPLIVSNIIIKNNILGPCEHAAYRGGGIWVDSTSNPIIGGSQSDANNIYSNYAVEGLQLYRNGSGKVINARFNYWGSCPPRTFDVWPTKQFDISNYLDNPVKVRHSNNHYLSPNFQLSQNYPNPFNASTSIEFYLPYSSYVDLKIFNLQGEKVETLIDRKLMAGTYKISWNANGLASGIYLYRLRANSFIEKRKLILLK